MPLSPEALETSSWWKDPEDGARQGLGLSLQPGAGRGGWGCPQEHEFFRAAAAGPAALLQFPPQHVESAFPLCSFQDSTAVSVSALVWAQPAAAHSLRLRPRRKGSQASPLCPEHRGAPRPLPQNGSWRWGTGPLPGVCLSSPKPAVCHRTAPLPLLWGGLLCPQPFPQHPSRPLTPQPAGGWVARDGNPGSVP